MESAQKIINYFSVLKEKQAIASSYIFIGDDFSLVNRISSLVNCSQSPVFCGSCWSCRRIKNRNHPDLLLIEPEGLSIKAEAVRQSIRFLSLAGYYSARKILIVNDAHKLTPEAASLFLKILEEPPPNCFIALCLPKLEGILPTIASRCRKIYLPYNKKEEILFSAEVEEFKKSGALPFFKDRKNFALFLENLIISLHGQLRFCFSRRQPPQAGKKTADLSFKKTVAVLEELFRVYKAHKTVNINLALNLIKMKLG